MSIVLLAVWWLSIRIFPYINACETWHKNVDKILRDERYMLLFLIWKIMRRPLYAKKNLKTQQSAAILDLCFRQPRAGKSRDFRDVIVLISIFPFKFFFVHYNNNNNNKNNNNNNK